MVSSRNKLLLLSLFLAGFYAVWTAWVFLLVQYPDLNQGGILRAAVRLLIWIVPVFLFVRLVEEPPVLDQLGLRRAARQGFSIGLAGFGAVLLLTAAQHGFILHLRFPRDTATWLNPIGTAPLAEELLFRGLVFSILRERFGMVTGLVASALLFSLAHLPYWWMSGDKAGTALLVELASMFAYGLLFAGLFQWSGSLWSPLVCHWLNNLLMVSLSR